jgi:predicted MPP superfamily phosphohydrolase
MQRPFFSRRQLILGGAGSALMLAMDAFCLEPRWLQVTEHDIPVPNLPKTLDGYRIAQVTDAHLRQIGMVEEKIVREIENRDVALIVLTGDMIDDPVRMNVLKDFCRNLQETRRMVLATLGNWEHWAPIRLSVLRDVYRSHRIKLLVNESELIGSGVCVTATDDAVGGRVLLDRAMSGYRKAAANLFLTHSPGLLDRLPGRLGPFDLALAGHTHGGQGRIGSFAPMRPYGSGRFLSGWYQVPVGRAYVSCGTGTSAIPARFACRPELPIFTLRQG